MLGFYLQDVKSSRTAPMVLTALLLLAFAFEAHAQTKLPKPGNVTLTGGTVETGSLPLLLGWDLDTVERTYEYQWRDDDETWDENPIDTLTDAPTPGDSRGGVVQIKGAAEIVHARVRTAGPLADGEQKSDWVEATYVPHPFDLNATGRTITSIDLQWKSALPTGADWYVQARRSDGAWPTSDGEKTNGEKMFTVSDLVPNTAYDFRVRTCRMNDCSDWKELEDERTDPLADPSGPFRVTEKPGEITVQWQHDGGEGVFFRTQIRENPGEWPEGDGTYVSSLEQTVTGLTPGTAYIFRVRACVGSSYCGEWVHISAGTDNLPPPPSNLTAAEAELTRIRYTWTYSYQPYLDGKVTFERQIKTWTESWPDGPGQNIGTDLTRTETGLTPATTYDFRVRACVDSYCGEWTEMAQRQTERLVAPYVNSARFFLTRLRYEWTYDHADEVSFRVQIKEYDAAEWPDSTDIGSALEHTFTDLSPNTRYNFRIRACLPGTDTCSGWAEQNTGRTKPVAPADIYTNPEPLHSRIIYRWFHESIGEVTFRVQFKNTDEAWPEGEGQDVGSEVTYSHVINPSTSYDFRVRACYGDVCSDWAEKLDTVTPPLTKPRDVIVTRNEFSDGGLVEIRQDWTLDYADVVDLIWHSVKRSDETEWTDSFYHPRNTGYSTYSNTQNLAPATAYDSRFRACFLGPCSEWTYNNNVYTLVPAPATVQAATDHWDRITYYWQWPNDNLEDRYSKSDPKKGPNPVVYYGQFVEQGLGWPDGMGMYFGAGERAPGGELTTTLDVPNPGVRYDFRVRACAEAKRDWCGEWTTLRGLPVPDASVSPTSLTEAQLDGAELIMNIVFGGSYNSPIPASAVSVSGIDGVRVASVSRQTETRARVILAYDGTDFQTVRDLSFTIEEAAHRRSGAFRVSNKVAVTPTPGVIVSPTSLDLEEGKSGSYTVVLDSEPTGDVTVTVAGFNNSSVSVDTDPNTSGDQNEIVFTTTNYNTERTVAVRAAMDDANFTGETVVLSHDASSSDALYDDIDIDDVTVAVTDNDEPELSISSPSVTEGNENETATLAFEITLSGESDRKVTVDWAPAADPGSATSGTDYEALTGQTLEFDPSQTSKTVNVTVLGDDIDESNETVVVQISNASNATISTGTGTGTITDDDDAPAVTLSLNPTSISENGGVSTVTATLSHASSAPTTVNLTTTPGAGTTTSDYTPQ